MKLLIQFLLMLVFSSSSIQLMALEINHVYHKPDIFNPSKSEVATVFFNISSAASVRLNVYDDRDMLISTRLKKNLFAGDHFIKWDGKDTAGNHVPPEAYRYTLVAHDDDGKKSEHDLTDLTGEKRYVIRDIKWDAELHQFKYTLPEPARIMIRVGLNNHGPLLASVVNWVPRLSGDQVEYWDGKDSSKFLDLTNHPNIQIDIQAYTLSKNTLFVGPKSDQVKFIEAPWVKEKRQRKKYKKKQMIAAQQQKPASRGDYLALLTLPDDLPKNQNGVPVVSTIIPVIISVAPKYQQLVQNRRQESVFFIDGQFVFENEVGYLPKTWMLDVKNISEGEHFLTVNIRGYEGNFGLATTKIFVKHEKKSNRYDT